MKKTVFLNSAKGIRLSLPLVTVCLLLVGLQVKISYSAPGWRERRAFVAKLQREFGELERNQKSEMKSFRAEQKAARKEWEKQGRNERRECFKRASRGSEKRSCVQALLAQRKTLVDRQKLELKERKREQRESRRQLEEDQRRRLAEFDRAIGSQSEASSTSEKESSH